MHNRFNDAVFVVDPGMWDPSDVARVIIRACQAVRDEGGGTDAIRSDPAVRLMVTQLAYLCNANSDIDDWGSLLAECRSALIRPPL